MTARKRGGSNQKVANSLVALSSAVVLTVYTAGYLRTRPAAQRYAVESAQRRIDSPAAVPSSSSDAPTSVGRAPQRRTAPSGPAPAFAAAPNVAPAPEPAETPTPLPSSPVPSVPSVSSLPSAEPANVQAESPATTPEQEPRTAESPAASTAAQEGRYKDGTYLGWGSCRHGDIQASVVIEAGRIASATIARCLTRYSCSWIEALPGQVVSRQSTNVDYVSGATQSTDAFAEAK
jgi:uncharacterized protein with FMN-binding domain